MAFRDRLAKLSKGLENSEELKLRRNIARYVEQSLEKNHALEDFKIVDTIYGPDCPQDIKNFIIDSVWTYIFNKHGIRVDVGRCEWIFYQTGYRYKAEEKIDYLIEKAKQKLE